MSQKRDNNQPVKIPWHSLKTEEVLSKTQSSIDGLTISDASERNTIHGKNILPKKKPKSILLMFLEELINPIVLILL